MAHGKAKPHFDDECGAIRPGNLPKVLDCSRTTAWRVSQEPDFPKPVQIYGTVYGYRKADLNRWLEKRSVR